MHANNNHTLLYLSNKSQYNRLFFINITNLLNSSEAPTQSHSIGWARSWHIRPSQANNALKAPQSHIVYSPGSQPTLIIDVSAY